ncbi:MAG: hypothetical protein K8F92_11590 [Hyphomicrobium sp.]|uniref:hypothetical protein n=1 Tax=Hyphomicrobium sp. TaxID=82 RepID=UPI001324E7B0|nr:hypothetical protein [Hyphomicrobium sp.]KAB2941751.1 MAG: hypothetical protein F9K20_08355 [Hyphomicrobium sp.]MBZ0210281.1 hypothetical protein [Hyphomicrobium sp.]
MSDCAPRTLAPPPAVARALVVLALALSFLQTPAWAEKIYAGITPDELVDFARREGWKAGVESPAAPVVVIDLEGEPTTRRPIRIELSECDQHKRCMTGLLRDMTYYSLKPEAYGFWHWNLERRGATGFGPSYITLQRYLHFNGVTDRYLRDVIGTIWPKAASSFWDEVERRSEAERQSEEAKDEN